jgi:hypothetical protein
MKLDLRPNALEWIGYVLVIAGLHWAFVKRNEVAGLPAVEFGLFFILAGGLVGWLSNKQK